MRLIDADQTASIENLDQYSDLAAALGDVQTVRDILSDAPTIDAVPVVRCRECKHYHADTGWCNQLSYFQNSDGEPCSPAESMEWKMFMEDDFCSYGQRKETTHD